MISSDSNADQNKAEHSSKWLQISDHFYRILAIVGSGTDKTKIGTLKI